MKTKNNRIVVVIPYYNASKHIASVINKLPDYIDGIIIVNDKSPDVLPFEIIKSEKNQKTELFIIDCEVNLGVGGATKKGFQFAIEKGFDIVIKVDADDQMDISYLPEMIKPLIENKAHVSKGNRFKRTKELKKMPLVRRIGNLGISFLAKIATGYWNNFDPTNGFIAIKTNVLKDIDFENLSNRYFFETSLLSEFYFNGVKIKDITMPAIYGDEKSSMKVWKMPFVFSFNLLKLFVKRILKSYFLYDFNIGSVYLIFGKLLFLFGLIFGGMNWHHYAQIKTPTPTGTIMIATISLILGFQLLLQFIQYDIFNAPKVVDNE
ncbi:glycosyltransferase family 2 protein [Flavobacterium sp.]|uniref:glycosyltransferase family 2 protein n=1 Tax=Flavobacterium sp. TaxID=239 RepID=UPI003D2E7E5D